MPVPGDNPAQDAETLVPTLVGVSIALVSMSSIIVALRLYTRFFIVRSPGADDITIAVAQVLSIGVSVVTILQAKYALGRHVWMVSPEDNISQLKCFLAAMLIYNLAQIVTKMSFLLQYRRIFQEGGRTRRVCIALLIFLACWGVTQEVLVAFACVPTSLFIPSQVPICINSLMVYYLTSVMNIVTDFIVFTVPLPAIRSLHLPRRQKLLVTGIFCLGFFTCIISIVRLFFLHLTINTVDPTWDNVPSAWLSVVELNCGILCASLPPLRALLRRLHFPGFHGSSNGYRRDHSDEGRKGSKDTENSHSRGIPGAGAAAIYPLQSQMGVTTNVTTASQEELHQNAAAPPESVYRSPEYAGHHGGRNKVAKLTNSIRGGRGTGSASASAAANSVDGQGGGNRDGDYHDSGNATLGHHGSKRARRKASASGITVTREIGVEKESIVVDDGRIRTSTTTDGDEEAGEAGLNRSHSFHHQHVRL